MPKGVVQNLTHCAVYLFTLLMTVFTKACDAYQKFTTYIITEPTGI